MELESLNYLQNSYCIITPTYQRIDSSLWSLINSSCRWMDGFAESQQSTEIQFSRLKREDGPLMTSLELLNYLRPEAFSDEISA